MSPRHLLHASAAALLVSWSAAPQAQEVCCKNQPEPEAQLAQAAKPKPTEEDCCKKTPKAEADKVDVRESRPAADAAVRSPASTATLRDAASSTATRR